MPKRRLLSFKYAFQGLAYLFRTQPNARIHLVTLMAVVGGGWFFSLSPSEWLAILLAATLVLSLEAVNTAIEALTDLTSPGHHPLAGTAKDVAAGAVLIAAIGAAVIGAIVFLPKISLFFQAAQ
jgi:diacylglycerol kinase (ATP)